MTVAHHEITIERSTGWRRQTLRYGFHLTAAYLIWRFVARWLAPAAVWLLSRWFPSLREFNGLQFLLNSLIPFNLLPPFVAASIINTKLRHRAACFVWIVPTVVFLYAFVFHTPGIYPTIPLESEFGTALHFVFLPSFHITNHESYIHEVTSAYVQLRYTAPLYVGVAYSAGAWLALRSTSRRLAAILAKW